MMKINKITFAACALALSSLTGCVEQYDPQTSTVTINQAAAAPNSFDKFVSAITNDMNGQPMMMGTSGLSSYSFDFGYPSQMLQRDLMGQDMAYPMNAGSTWFPCWYAEFSVLSPEYLVCQIPWTSYYAWIKNCNNVIKMVGDTPSDNEKVGAGIAYAMRAFFYQDLAQMYCQETYTKNKNAETVPLVTGEVMDMYHNPRATNEKMWAFILGDLDKAEQYLAGYKRTDKTTPDVSVVYGLKARAYLIMGDWKNAEKYANLAQQGYSVMTASEYTDRETGFNTPNEAWMFCLTYNATDPCIKYNDADTSWGSQMSLEINPDKNVSACGYAANYGDAKLIDRHLYESIPSTDCRKKCFVDFSTNDMSGTELENKLREYSDYPSWLEFSARKSEWPGTGGLCLKFRTAGGTEGHNNQYKGFLQSIPLMRVEEMKLIEAEAAGMQEEARGVALLEAFAKTRDPQYVYGKHNEAYGNASTSKFQNEVWWQRRVELWGEGFSTLDIKRLSKSIIRSYAGTNHVEGYRWNTNGVPQWMTLCIVSSEGQYNKDCTQNPTPVAPTTDSPEFVW